MKILFFSPHSELWIHAFPEALVAESLQQHGHEVIYVSCGQAFDRFCVPMAAHKMTPDTPAIERQGICDHCRKSDQLLRGALNLRGPTLDEILTSEDRADVDRILEKVDRTNFYDLQCEGVPVGRIALYQVILHHKKFNTDFNDPEWVQYVVELDNALRSLKAMQRLVERYQPDRILLYNGLYAVNHVAAFFAEAKGVPCYFMHAGPSFYRRLQRLTIGRGNPFSYMPKLLEQWPRFAVLPCPPRYLTQVTNHLLELFRGQSIFAYSPMKTGKYFDARKFFGVGPNQKLLIATMSSNDEYMAGILVGAQKPWGKLLFDSQIRWIEALIEFATSRSDLFIVIRVHPREFPNRRDHKKSQHAQELEAAFVSLPENVIVNWPSDGVSIYDLVDQTDVFLNAWSTTGKDMPMLGVPVVVYSSLLPLYPVSLNYLGETQEAYFAAIDTALSDGWSLERVRLAYRWAVYEFIRATIDISDGYSEVEGAARPFLRKVVDRLKRRINPDFVKLRDIGKRNPELKASEQIDALLSTASTTVVELESARALDGVDAEQESAGLAVELRRLAEALYPTPEARAASRLYARLTALA
jgi:hypothetical protein